MPSMYDCFGYFDRAGFFIFPSSSPFFVFFLTFVCICVDSALPFPTFLASCFPVCRLRARLGPPGPVRAVGAEKSNAQAALFARAASSSTKPVSTAKTTEHSRDTPLKCEYIL